MGEPPFSRNAGAVVPGSLLLKAPPPKLGAWKLALPLTNASEMLPLAALATSTRPVAAVVVMVFQVFPPTVPVVPTPPAPTLAKSGTSPLAFHIDDLENWF